MIFGLKNLKNSKFRGYLARKSRKKTSKKDSERFDHHGDRTPDPLSDRHCYLNHSARIKNVRKIAILGLKTSFFKFLSAKNPSFLWISPISGSPKLPTVGPTRIWKTAGFVQRVVHNRSALEAKNYVLIVPKTFYPFHSPFLHMNLVFPVYPVICIIRIDQSPRPTH